MAKGKSTKAELKIVLKADETLVADSTDPILWQKVLAAINIQSEASKNASLEGISQNDKYDLSFTKEPVDQMAKEIGVSADVLKGACDPSNTKPFIHLDRHHWEAMKKSTPPRGPKAISPIALAATLLILWKEKAKLGDSTIDGSQDVLATIGLSDKHPGRALNNCEWLQLRGKTIIINPAQTSKAISLAKGYCTKKWDKE